MHACDFHDCNYVGARASYLQAHKRVHIGLNSHPCPDFDCSGNFATAASLRSHLLCAHTDVKPFVCSVSGCEFRTTSNILLRSHALRHTGIKPFICEVANCTFSSYARRSLVTHSRKQHNTFPPRKLPGRKSSQ